MVIPYAYQLHDEKYWDNPYKFDLKNYLDENNKYKPNTIAANQFGQGKRQCPGMQFAKRMIYIILVKLILKYEFYAKNNNGDNIEIEQWDGTGIARQSLKKISIGIRQRK